MSGLIKNKITFSTADSLCDFRDYVVLDFETTGLSAASCQIIEIGAVRIHDDKIEDKYQSFVNPHISLPAAITELTGITDQMLADAPDIIQALPEFIRFCGGLPLVAHNAAFDLDFLDHALIKCELDLDADYVDTLAISRIAYPELATHKLEYLVKNLNLKSPNKLTDIIKALHLPLKVRSHRAIDDAISAYYLLINCKCAYPERIKKRSPRKSSSKLNLAEFSPEGPVSEDHPLYGKNIVFTGELSIPRKEAAQMAINMGANVKNGISKKIDYLVSGTQNLSVVDSSGMSSKEQKTWELIREGYPIMIIDEDVFRRLLAGEDA